MLANGDTGLELSDEIGPRLTPNPSSETATSGESSSPSRAGGTSTARVSGTRMPCSFSDELGASFPFEEISAGSSAPPAKK